MLWSHLVVFRHDVGMTETQVLEVACDESGAEGENVAQSRHRVFCHGSVTLSRDEARSVIAELRGRTGSSRSELKAEAVLRSADAVGWLLDPSGPLTGRALMVLVDKQYFLIAKVVDLLVEELTHARGENLYAGDKARKMAWRLFREGHRALGDALWGELLDAVNSLMRMKQRRGTKATADDFFDVVERAQLRSHRRNVSDTLALVYEARSHVEQFQRFIATYPDTAPSLDPLVAVIPTTARWWAETTGREVELVHDTQAVLTHDRVDELVQGIRHPHPEFAWIAPPVKIRDIVQVDSKTDQRVQVADIVAGIGRWAAMASLEGPVEPPRLIWPFVCNESIWADVASFQSLTGRSEPGR